MIDKKTWHVTTGDGFFVKDYATEGEAMASAQDRNARAAAIGSSAVYAVEEKP